MLFYAVVAAFAVMHFTDPDYWWHLRTGKLILETGSIPTTDPFSHTADGREWVAHEWLSQVVIAGIQTLLGYAGNTLLFGGMAVTALAVSHRTALSSGVARPVALLLAISVAAMSIPYWTVRPQVFTWLLLAVFINVFVTYRSGGPDRLWLLPLVMLLWANLHAGYVIGLGVFALFLLAEGVERASGWHQHDLRKPALVFAAAFLITALNPSTVDLWLYPLSYLEPGDASFEVISEWQSPDFHLSLHWPLALAVLALVTTGVVNSRGGLFLSLLALVFTGLTLHAARNQPLFALVFLPVMGAQIASMDLKLGWNKPSPVHSGLNWGILAGCVLVGFAIVVANPKSQLGDHALLTGRVDYPSGGAAFIHENYPDARIYNEFVWGGYLVETLYPQKVFIDGRPDMYGEAIVSEYLQVNRMEGDWQGVLARYGVDVVIVERGTPLAKELAKSWRTVFTGPVEVVLAR